MNQILLYFRLERLYYYSKRDESRSDPEHYLSLIIDGMDQCKYMFYNIHGDSERCLPNPEECLKNSDW